MDCKQQMRSRLRRSFGVLLGCLLWLSACAKNQPLKTPPSLPEATPTSSIPTEHDADCKDHDRHGETASSLTIDIGAHEFLGRFDFNSAENTVILIVNDHDTGKPYPHEIAGATLNLLLDGGSKQLTLIADPLPDDPEGKTSRYKAVDECLKGLKTFKGRLNLVIDGKTYLSDLSRGH